MTRIALALLLLFGAAALAADAVPTLPVESPIMPSQYVLMPGDRLLVTIAGGVTYSYDAGVTYEGRLAISIPQVGVADAVMVSGLTISQAEDSLTARMARYYKKVTATLTLTGMRSGTVYVSGEVQSPGAQIATPIDRVSAVIARAGGLAPLGSRTRIQLRRAGRLFATVDIARLESTGDLSADPFVQSGDIIYVPPVEALVTVKGAVFGRGEYRLRASTTTTEKERVSEGIYELAEGERVSELIAKAGGVTPWADMSSAYIERLVVGGGGLRKKLLFDLRRVLFESDSTANPELMNADILVVPPINTLVYVEGEVNEPSAYAYTPNLRFRDYVGMAGGPTNYAAMNIAHIVRGSRNVSARNNPVVEPGDIVMVPRVVLKWWQDYVSIISAIGIPIATVLLTLTLR